MLKASQEVHLGSTDSRIFKIDNGRVGDDPADLF